MEEPYRMLRLAGARATLLREIEAALFAQLLELRFQ